MSSHRKSAASHVSRRSSGGKRRGAGHPVGISRRSNDAQFATSEHAGSVPRMVVPENTVYTVVQQLPDSTFSQTATTFAHSAASYGFGQVPGYAAYAAVFDQYRFDELQVTFRPMFTANPLAALSSIIVPRLFLVVDYDDSNTTSWTAANFEQYGKLQITVNEISSVTFRPHIAVAGGYGGTFSQYTNEPAKWTDCASQNLTHYGIKFGCDAGDSGQTALQTWNVSVRVRISFRNPI